MNFAAGAGQDYESNSLGIPRATIPAITNARRGLLRRMFKLLTKRTFVLLTIAFIILFLALALDQYGAAGPKLWSINTLSELLREVAFACLIAFAIIATVELESREERDQRAEDERIKFMAEVKTERNRFLDAINDRITDIRKDIFFATFERHIPRQIVDEIDLLVFSADFIRIDHHQTLRLRNINAVDLDEGLKPCELIELAIDGEYTVQNVSAASKPFEIKLFSEIPPDKVLHKYVKVELLSVSLDGKEKHPEKVKDVERDAHTVGKIWTIEDIPAQSKLKVFTKTILIKYPNDYEVWRSAYPTSQLKFTVEFPEKAQAFNALALHRLPLIPKGWDARRFDYEVSGPLLPHQGVVVWWVCNPTGLDQMSEDVTYVSAG
jgi:hypothetical protein